MLMYLKIGLVGVRVGCRSEAAGRALDSQSLSGAQSFMTRPSRMWPLAWLVVVVRPSLTARELRHSGGKIVLLTRGRQAGG